MTHPSGPELSEKAVQARVRRLYLDVGAEVFSTSSVRRARIAKGMADLYVLHPKFSLWFEAKRAGGKQSPAQVAFQHSCERAGVRYLCGGLDVAVEHLQRIGVLPHEQRFAIIAGNNTATAISVDTRILGMW